MKEDEDLLGTKKKKSVTSEGKSSAPSVKDLLRQSINEINKKFGDRSVIFFTEGTKVDDIECISTGSLKIDYMTGINGIPVGRITEIYGHEGSGKTTLALSIVTQAQKAGHTCLYVDLENSLNITYAQQLGVNIADLVFTQPDSAEQAFEIIEKLIRSCTVKVIVVDSVSAIVPKAELEMNFSESQIGGQARLMSSALRRLASIVNQCGCALIFINQIRQKIGVMFGNNETTSGGIALKFYTSLRIEIHKRALIKDAGGVAIGQDLAIKIVKNKFASPYVSDTVQLMYGRGFDKHSEMFDLGVKFGFFTKKGSWYGLSDGTMIGQGKESCVDKLASNSELHDNLLKFLNARAKNSFNPAFDSEEESDSSEKAAPSDY